MSSFLFGSCGDLLRLRSVDGRLAVGSDSISAGLSCSWLVLFGGPEGWDGGVRSVSDISDSARSSQVYV